MRLLGLANRCRAMGLSVIEVPGWKTRGVEFAVRPKVVVAHHTATAASAPGDYPSLGIVRDGRPDLDGPLSQTGLGRGGSAYIIASGKANHAGPGDWDGITSSALTIGCEAESPGHGEWTNAQLKAYPVLLAAMAAELGLTSGSRVCGHREWANPPGRKIDPVGWNLDTLRQQVTSVLTPHASWWTHEIKRGEVDASVRRAKHVLKLNLTGPDANKYTEDLTRAVNAVLRKHGLPTDGAHITAATSLLIGE